MAISSMDKLKEKVKNTHVPDKVYSYTLQVNHMLYELIDAGEGDVISIEALDDIALHKIDGSIEVQQVKSVLSKNNPVSDRARDFWKTFYNWLIAVKTGELFLPKTKFKLFVTADRTDYIVEKFNSANTLEQAKQALNEAKVLIFGSDNQNNIPHSYKEYVNFIFDSSNEEDISMIIVNFKYQHGNESYFEDLFNKFKKQLIPEEFLDNIFIYCLGWIDKIVSQQLEENKPAYINQKEYRKELLACLRKYNQVAVLQAFSSKPTEVEVENEIKKLSVYLQQLDFIDSDYSEKIEAVNDYLMSSVDRTMWAQKGLVHYSSFDEYERVLIRTWRHEDKIGKIINCDKEDQIKGRLLYLNCIEKQIPLQGLQVPVHFTSGSFHTISNKKQIGWHPDYERLLQEGDNNGNIER
jgi:hypothetical protein